MVVVESTEECFACDKCYAMFLYLGEMKRFPRYSSIGLAPEEDWGHLCPNCQLLHPLLAKDCL